MSGAGIVGYVLAEQPFCPECIHDLFIPFDLVGRPERSAEDILNVVARQRGIDRNNENSFSSYVFPKPILAADVSGVEVCISCGRLLTSSSDMAT